jgi:catechol 2,3-dioxygenase-like lactoylglutathione lyase family enzyme
MWSVKQRVGVITLGVPDLANARAFYEALGWKSGAKPGDDVVFFQAGGMVLALWDRALLAEDSAVSDGGGWGGVTLAHNVGSPEEVDAVIEEARAAGATIGCEPATTFWGGYSGVFVDPAGHPWEVAHNPHWGVTADGDVVLNP